MTDPPPTAVLLLAGRSRRTWPLTENLPKPLLPLWGRPLTERVLDQLQSVVEEAILVVGYRRDRILAALGDRHGGVRLTPVIQREARGTADALRAAAPALSGRALVINGDDFYHAEDLARLASSGTAILCQEASDPWNRATVEVDGDGFLRNLIEKPADAPPGALASIGAYSLRREDLAGLAEVEESVRGELELPDLIRGLAKERGVRAVRARKPWIPLTYAWDPIGRVVPLFEADGSPGPGARDLGLRTTPGVGRGAVLALPGSEIHPDADVSGPAVIGPGARVLAGARIERAVLLAGASVGRGATVRDSVLGEGASVGDGAELRSGPVADVRVLDHRARPGVSEIGACLGDGARVPPGAVVPPGTLVAPKTVWSGDGSPRGQDRRRNSR